MNFDSLDTPSQAQRDAVEPVSQTLSDSIDVADTLRKIMEASAQADAISEMLGQLKPEPEPEHVEFASGAKRSEVAPSYHLIPPEALERLAKRYTMGADKYGILNYLVGINDPGFIRQILDHMQAHFHDYVLNGSAKDDNLAGIMWGCATLMMIEAHNPSILDEEIFARRRNAIADAIALPRPQQNLYQGKPKP